MDEIKFKYIFKEDFNPKYINGVQGGINHSGEIIINFFFERPPLPITEAYTLKENNSELNLVASKPDDMNNSFVRVVENGVILNYQSAKELYNWLGHHISILEDLVNIDKTI